MELSRRRLLAGAGVAALSATAGCSLPFGGGPSVDLGPIPASADTVARLDVAAALADPAVEPVVDAALAAGPVRAALTSIPRVSADEVPADLADARSTLGSTYGLDPGGLSTVTAFGTATLGSAGAVAGALFEAEWTPGEVTDALRASGLSVTERSVGGRTVYAVDGAPLDFGVLGEGRYVLGLGATVLRVTAVADGDADALGDPVRSAFAATGEGPVRLAAAAGPVVDLVTGLIPGDVELIREQLFAELATVAGSLSVDGETRTLTVRARADSASTAEDVASTVTAARNVAASGAAAPLRAAIQSITVDRDGRTVTISYSGSVAELTELARAVSGGASS